MWMIECDGDELGQFGNYSTRQKYGNSFGCSGGGCLGAATYSAIAVRHSNGSWQGGQYGSSAAPDSTGPVLAFSHITNTSVSVSAITRDYPTEGLAMIASVVEQTVLSAPSVRLGTQSDDAITNLVSIAMTEAGGRANLQYQDTSGTTYTFKDGIDSYTVNDTSWNSKSDIFALSSNNTGNWNFINRVGSKYRAVLRDAGQLAQGEVGAWMGEVIADGDVHGTDAVPLLADWTDDASATGTGLGNGDYTPGPLTELPQIPAGETAFPFDQKGRAVPTDGTAYVGAIQKV